MTPLAERLERRIAADGPITVADYMAAALYDPAAGYYSTGRPLGRDGDFTTAPEISQMFGELLGLWCADAWLRLGRPRPVRLVELGPGRGTLLADALRALRVLPELLEALEIHLVEIGRELRRDQERALAGHACRWHDSLHAVPEGPLLLLANEFFDALPVRQFERTPGGWRERLVGPGLRVALSGAVPPALIPEALRDAAAGSVFELCPAGLSLAGEIGRRVAASGGAALLVDYGYAAPPLKGTLQAIRRQRPADPFDAPGEADLSTHVDFAALADAARRAGAEAHGPVGQGALLAALGIAQRADRLKRSSVDPSGVEAALRRLTAPDQMGQLFKALALVPPGFGPPAGF